VERFAAEPGPTESAGGAFEVELARSGRRLAVPAGASILQVLLAAGVDVDYSCQEGSCGACETRVLEGRPEHRDGVLSKAEREAGATMMICVSGCRGERLVLDL
jgi:ferredoxin--NADP+ reductase/vanillate O-demethylase ferredoxin subunit